MPLSKRRTSAADAEPRPAEFVLQHYEVLEDEFACINGREPDRISMRFEPEQIRDLPEMIRLLQQEPKSDALAWIVEQMTSTRTQLERYLASKEGVEREGSERQLRLCLVQDLNGLIGTSLAGVPVARSGAERSLTRSLIEGYPERTAPVAPDLLDRLLLEDIFPRALWRIEDLRLADIYRQIHARQHTALCLSGGGIRSATFALGLVQSFARHGVLDRFDYLSTVSGGGYLGGWLSAWMAHTSPNQVLAELDPEHLARAAKPPIHSSSIEPEVDSARAYGEAPAPEPRPILSPEPAPIHHLRSYSNYLTPRIGVFSADTWALVATVLRNLFLNWLVVLPPLVAAVLVPHLALSVIEWAPPPGSWLGSMMVGTLAALGLVCGVAAVAYIHEEPPAKPTAPKDATSEGGSPSAQAPAPEAPASTATPGVPKGRRESVGDTYEFLTHCFGPLLASAALLTTVWWWVTSPEWGFALETWGKLSYLVSIGIAIHLGGWAVAKLRVAYRDAAHTPWRLMRWEVRRVVFTGLMGGLLGYVAASLIVAGATLLERPTHAYVILALPLFLTVLLFGGHLYVGLTSGWMTSEETPERAEHLGEKRHVGLASGALPGDEAREWAARFGAWLLIAATGWLVLSALVLEGPRLFATAFSYLIGAGVLSGMAAVLLGRSAKTAGGPTPTAPNHVSPLRGQLLSVLTLLFMAILVVVLSWLGAHLVGAMQTAMLWFGLTLAAPAMVLLTGALLLLVGLAMGRLINTNLFSLHAMYRMRLIRAYLGASRPAGSRKPDPFTGFDPEDNLPMHRLWPGWDEPVPGRAPLHIVNVALNLVGGHSLAWQERKAESFTISPLHAGAASLGYRRTSPDRNSNDGPERLYGDGITLGTAMTISGAAANPNMGYYSSAAVTFLMTLFNARLGWWLGNPGPAGQATFDHAGPQRAGITPILSEMFGMTTNRSEYVQLSDGGHFENLGLYEMVRRRCKLIVVSDASCDPDCTLSDLGGAIRKIRVDMGIPIDFADDFRIFARSSSERSGRCWALGRIRYSAVDRPIRPDGPAEELDGTLIYIKPTFYGSEPRDIYNYAHAHPDFPHQSTVDQFFSESQFESYRALGLHAANSVLRDLDVRVPDRPTVHTSPYGLPDWSGFSVIQRDPADRVYSEPNRPLIPTEVVHRY